MNVNHRYSGDAVIAGKVSCFALATYMLTSCDGLDACNSVAAPEQVTPEQKSGPSHSGDVEQHWSMSLSLRADKSSKCLAVRCDSGSVLGATIIWPADDSYTCCRQLPHPEQPAAHDSPFLCCSSGPVRGAILQTWQAQESNVSDVDTKPNSCAL